MAEEEEGGVDGEEEADLVVAISGDKEAVDTCIEALVGHVNRD